MDPYRNFFNLIGCIALVAFFTAFVLTFWPAKIRLRVASILYGIGIIASLSPYAYFRFIRGVTNTFSSFPTLGWLLPIHFLCFAIAAALLLWPIVSPSAAFKSSIILFFVIAPILIFLKLLPEHIQFHGPMRFLDPSWIVYAILWFRIHDASQRQRVPC
jgi:hypothetical protein